jgi:two-component system, OmpR family, sensor histidine kinase TctE
MPPLFASSAAWDIGSMTASPDRAPSIRRRLLALLVVPATLVLLAGAASDFISGITPVRDAYDRALADAALAVAAHVRTDASGRLSVVFPEEAIAVLRADSTDTIYFRVSGPDGSFLAGDKDLPVVDTRSANPAYRDLVVRGMPTRVVSYRSGTSVGNVTTTVGETINKRERVRNSLLLSVLGADMVELALILALVWIGVSIALRPLSELRQQVAKRSPRDLQPFALGSVPTEVHAVVCELNRLFATIAASSRSQRQFLESAAHQLRTPLAGVQAQLELLMGEEAIQARRERLALTLGATQRLSHTTQQLLALARSEHAASTFSDFRAVDLATIAEGCIADRISRAITAGVDLGGELDSASVDGISWLLGEAVGNLVDNAITYTPAGGSVTVRCGRQGETAFIEVIDTGAGIPPEEREQVTSRFFRGQHSRGVGSGLGLAIVADVARLHGAALTITAGPEDRGTCVRLRFPALSA